MLQMLPLDIVYVILKYDNAIAPFYPEISWIYSVYSMHGIDHNVYPNVKYLKISRGPVRLDEIFACAPNVEHLSITGPLAGHETGWKRTEPIFELNMFYSNVYNFENVNVKKLCIMFRELTSVSLNCERLVELELSFVILKDAVFSSLRTLTCNDSVILNGPAGQDPLVGLEYVYITETIIEYLDLSKSMDTKSLVFDTADIYEIIMPEVVQKLVLRNCCMQEYLLTDLSVISLNIYCCDIQFVPFINSLKSLTLKACYELTTVSRELTLDYLYIENCPCVSEYPDLSFIKSIHIQK
jgi:hypothetical protein